MDGNAAKIYVGRDFYVPTFQVKLAERVLPKDVVRDVIQVTYRDNIKEIDSFEITINNWDAEKRTFKYSDQPLFNPGKRLELWMGYFGQEPLQLMLNGEITALRPTFPASGQPTLAITGLNVLHHFRREQRSEAYIEVDDSQIATRIGNRLGVTVNTDEIARRNRYQYVFQDNKYDIVFLMERAHQIGCELVVGESGTNGQSEQPVLRFVPSDSVRRATYHLSYGSRFQPGLAEANRVSGAVRGSLIEFQPELTTAEQVNEVEVRGWDAQHKRPIRAIARRNQTRTRGAEEQQGHQGIRDSFSARREIIADRPVNSQQEAETMAREALERITKEMVKGRGSTIGLPDLRAGSVLLIDGLGERFVGRYFVTTTTHGISDGGYTTQFECRREELR